MTIPPPTPVPIVNATRESEPLPEPQTASAYAAAFASFAMKVGLRVAVASSFLYGTLFQPRFAAKTTVSPLTIPGATEPIHLTFFILMPCILQRSSQSAAISRQISSQERGAFVLTLFCLTIFLESISTRPAAILVPPRSTPMQKFECNILLSPKLYTIRTDFATLF